MLTVLLALTVLSGVVDAVCYLGLGRVFTANMTGNVVVIGFAAAGAPGFSVTASLTSLAVFLAGALAGGRLAAAVTRRSRLLPAAIALEAVLVGAAAAVASTAVTSAGGGRFTAIALLALAMGIRNAVITRLSVPGLSTTVLTGTLTGLAADSALAGGAGAHTGRRAASVLAMLGGAVAGAVLYLHTGPGLPLALAAAVAAAAAVIAAASSTVRGYLDQKR